MNIKAHLNMGLGQACQTHMIIKPGLDSGPLTALTRVVHLRRGTSSQAGIEFVRRWKLSASWLNLEFNKECPRRAWWIAKVLCSCH